MAITQLSPRANTAVSSTLFHFLDVNVIHHVIDEILVKPIHFDQIIADALAYRHRLTRVGRGGGWHDEGCPEEVDLSVLPVEEVLVDGCVVT